MEHAPEHHIQSDVADGGLELGVVGVDGVVGGSSSSVVPDSALSSSAHRTRMESFRCSVLTRVWPHFITLVPTFVITLQCRHHPCVSVRAQLPTKPAASAARRSS